MTPLLLAEKGQYIRMAELLKKLGARR